MRELNRVSELLDSEVVDAHVLQPESLMLRNKRIHKGQGDRVNPLAWLVTSADGRQYKVFEAEPENEFRLNAYIRNGLALAEESFVPDIVYI